MVATQMGLRARKKQATAAALQQSALELFLARGYDESTVQDITDAAGVSQRTFFRYYPTKDAVLLTEHDRRERELREALAARPADEPVGELVRAVVAHLVADVEERRDLIKVQNQVFQTVPVLADRFSGHHDRLAGIVAEHVAGQLGVEENSDPRPRLVGHQAVRVWTTAIYIWLADEMRGDLAPLADKALDAARNDPALAG